MTAQDHYATHLAPIYAWMVGNLDAVLARSAAELDSLELPDRADRSAVDLGAGLGLHAIPLAQRGYTVTAIDSNSRLLQELRQRSASLPIATFAADILAFPRYVQQPADLILCMGDTLTHLPGVASVESLIRSVAHCLNRGGAFVTTFRDYVSAPLTGDHRFIPVRSDAHRILTCFLEYSDDHVTVHDVLHELHSGRWQQRVSSYPKLRLAPGWVANRLSSSGLAVRRSTTPGGMTCLVATRD